MHHFFDDLYYFDAGPGGMPPVPEVRVLPNHRAVVTADVTSRERRPSTLDVAMQKIRSLRDDKPVEPARERAYRRCPFRVQPRPLRIATQERIRAGHLTYVENVREMATGYPHLLDQWLRAALGRGWTVTQTPPANRAGRP